MNPAEYDRMYDQEDSYWWFVGRRRLVLDLMAQRYGSRADLDILDVGCGTGAMSSALRRFGRVVSADLSDLALRYSARRGLTALCSADATRLPLRSESFDAIVALDLLEHIPDDAAAAHEFARALRPGGCLFATVPAYQSLWSGHDLALMHMRRYTAREVGRLVSGQALRVLRLSYAMTALFPIVWLVRMRERKAREPQASVRPVPPPINAALIRLLEIENRVLRRMNLPFGVTVLCVAEKPNGSHARSLQGPQGVRR
ncbi:MAG: class I SAM-dependent methyltransferase [Armatimonadetes bacterium]|nr:class I SAM-dependent methyltransferase [Armatimonadota bacterium]